MENKENSYRRCFVGCVGMERPNGAFDEKQFGIGGFT